MFENKQGMNPVDHLPSGFWFLGYVSTVDFLTIN